MVVDQLRFLFDPRGRIGRMPFVGAQIATFCFGLAPLIFIRPKAGMALVLDGETAMLETASAALPYYILTVVYVSLVTSIKRLRDMGRSPWWAALIYGPGFGIVALNFIFPFVSAEIETAVMGRVAAALDAVSAVGSPISLAVQGAQLGFKAWLALAPPKTSAEERAAEGGEDPTFAPETEALAPAPVFASIEADTEPRPLPRLPRAPGAVAFGRRALR